LDKAKAGLGEAGLGDLVLGGNYVCGVALGKVVDHGYELAQGAADRVSSSPAGSAPQTAAAAASSA